MAVLYLRDYTSDSADREAHPVIILHGLFGSGDNWGAVAKELGLVRRTYAIDLPGHGESPNQGMQSLDYLRMSKDLLESHRHFWGTEPAVYLGHSMGGKAAMALSLLAQELVSRLIVVDIAPKKYNRHHEEVLSALRAVEPGIIRSRSEAESAMSLHLHEPMMRGFLLKNLRPKTGEDGVPMGYEWRFDFPSLDRDYEQIMDWPFLTASGMARNEDSRTVVQRSSVPTLWVKGALSPYIDPELDGTTMVSLFPQTELVIIPGANHWVHVDQKSEFIAQVRRFLL